MALQITSLTPGLVMSATEVMCAGLLLGTISTSVLVANSTGLSTIPLAYSAAGCLGLAAANTSAGAPCSIWVSSAPEPPKVYLALGSICGKTLVRDAAASTVGASPPEPAVLVPDGAAAAEVALPVAAEVWLVVAEFPQPAVVAGKASAPTSTHHLSRLLTRRLGMTRRVAAATHRLPLTIVLGR